MIDFKMAEAAARNGFDDFIKGATNIVLEEIVISDDNSRYEVTFSYDVDRTPSSFSETRTRSPFYELAAIMGKRKEYKTFLVSSEAGALKGFKRYKGQ